MSGCDLCPGACEGADLARLTTPELSWLWEQLAARADRSGDLDLTVGRITLTVPADPRRSAAAGRLLSDRPPRGGTRPRADLARLTDKLRAAHGARLTPGAVAAHALRRPLGQDAQDRRAQHRRVSAIADRFRALLAELPDSARVRPAPEPALKALRGGRWLHRLADAPDGPLLAELATQVLAALPPPGERIDRRVLAQRFTGTPKALDRGSALAGLILALAAAAGAVTDPADQRTAWDGLGVDFDNLTGGLLSLNLWPAGYTLPADEPLPLTPYTLARCRWPPAPAPHAWVFVTENPSIVAALLDHTPLPAGARVLCTNGTPSALEATAIARLTESGWNIAARADFDAAGLRHLSAITAAQPATIPWRMAATDYRTTLRTGIARWVPPLDPAHLRPTPWDPALETAIRRHALPGYEEALLDDLIRDVLTGHPPPAPGPNRT
ncbi:DUF2399 domain-containing protein [Kitasatospora sp. NPDC057542]|uniref:DUF2399 domain-containing protein n=1 Tax=Kitasatospora sp. NPDC057542 TaxID=3346162 RepID=UPI003695A91C